MSNADHFASNQPSYFQPNQDYSQIMEGCNLESTMRARHEQSHGGQGAAGEDHSGSDPRTVLTYLTFLEQKIGHLRGIICSTPHPQQQIVSAELSCIIVQLISISKNLVAGTAASSSPRHNEEADAKSPLNAHEGSDSDQDHHHAEEVADADEQLLPPGSYEVIQIEKEELLAPHVHFCKVCGKGFKRDANLRMHMRGHGDEYKAAGALAKPGSRDTSPPGRCFYSCPYVGCKRNKEHKNFQPLKTPICVKNHYRRSHCDKSYTCRRCNVKKFSVLADLRTHEKHCGRDRWVCSCGTSFSRKDKLFGHVAIFDGHTPALPPEEAAGCGGTGSGMSGSDQLLLGSGEAVSRMVDMDQCFSESMFDDFRCSGIKGSVDDGRGYLSPMGLDSCDFDGFGLFGPPAIDF